MTGDSIDTFFACESVSLKLKPSKKFARTVRNRRLRLVIRVTAKDAAGNVTRAAKPVRVK